MRRDPCSLHGFEFEKLRDLAIEDESFQWSPSDSLIRAQREAMKEFLKWVEPARKRDDGEALYWRKDLEKAWHAVGSPLRPKPI